MIKIFFCLILFFSKFTYMLEDYVYVVGVVTIDVKKDGKFPENYTYVFTSYIKWLEENNVRWI